MAAYSNDLRDRVLAAYDRGMRTKQIAEVFQVSPAWARRIKQCRRETGRVRLLTATATLNAEQAWLNMRCSWR